MGVSGNLRPFPAYFGVKVGKYVLKCVKKRGEVGCFLNILILWIGNDVIKTQIDNYSITQQIFTDKQ